ncbi:MULTISPECIES: ATP-dependent DNA ligase [Mycobacterium]|uniref:DNA ligase (ATP) n=2 Tax=Mycobacterium avium complex (MAC) TaxID=120793 RepID=A0ABM7K9E4_9MYCO|nr:MULTISPECIES: ATP-dependent DNA ligase [Mycobacterium]AFC52451.1 ATP-dependent DNA ligase [Mycobacterium paraintracellulare]AFJ33900.1 ATP-dependent DNA ligase [Mycobacterium sp. MOTT36Y]AFS13064.1 Putative DNA ligase-like protein [Mycobacterium intracellulare subsp. intracellulare MTCC 9506]AGP62481.1 ATP-dependent DNA ligase [Mycobacterium intracellulare subsp. yongonense 05-1390]ARR76624.1 ATP-dependent DNA ligase clustered with Ku protein, LigD [Mycobacterium intracellulare subsp. yongo
MSPTAGPRVKLTNAEKVLYPATGTTKSDIFDYYTRIAEVMIPHIAGRPATRKRWPNGVEQESFFEKQLAASAPDWLPRASVTHRSGTTTYPIIDDPTGLAWIAQQAALEVHVPQWRFVAEWTRSRAEELKPGPATRLVFDLDPGEGVTMAQMSKVARAVRDLIAGIGLRTFPLTSGSKGLHLYAPLDEPVSSKGATVLAKRVAQQLEKTMPKLVTSTMTKSLRAGKIFLDWSQNNGSKTTIAPYSLRGREHPTVAAPRTWDELDDPSLRQLRYDEVLSRVARDGDLLAELDEDAPVPDRLTKYRSMRDASKTPEPVPAAKPAVGQGNTFVIQEHHARRLHYDFRLERDGVLVSWAVPKNLPETTSVNHLAVHTEDHPLEYGGFEGVIPKGEYGAGKVIIWDSGTYDAEKFLDDEVIVNLHGSKISGRYALIQTNGDQWLAHRMKDQKVFEFDTIAPMLATHGSVTALKAGQWAFEGKWDGYRLLIEADHGAFRVRSRRGREVTQEYRELRWLADDLADHHVVLDGEAVVLDSSGVPNFHEMQNRGRGSRVEFWAFDLLYLDGRSLLRARYRDRRKLLEMLAAGSRLIVPDLLPGDGREALEHSAERGWEGVIAKKRDSTYQPGRRSSSWIKDKHWNTQEVVIGGWKAGEGGRSSGIGSLLMGIPTAGGLHFAGRVGTGFTDRDLANLKKTLAPLHTDESPFDPPLPRSEARGVTYVRPELVGEVRYSEWTPDDRLRQSSWRGLRPDKEASEVVRE